MGNGREGLTARVTLTAEDAESAECRKYYVVIPIQCDEAVFSTDWAFWIPAFAGMTGELVVSRPIHGVFKTNWYK